MQRLLLQELIDWKQQEERKPVLIDGARQVGKTYLVQTLFAKHFRKVLKLDFLQTPSHCELFEDSLNPDHLIPKIELLLDQEFDPKRDMLFFDEIGECQRAIDSLKFFAEQRPDLYVCASGSNIGLLSSFPVGKVRQLELFPLCFEEFLMGFGQPRLVEAYRAMDFSATAHRKLYEQLIDYYFVGGMPEAVKTWFKEPDASIITRSRNVSRVHKDLIAGYQRDFGKYAGPNEATRIQAVFDNVPEQLSQFADKSVKRFKFKDVIRNKSRYRDFESAIDWLVKCRLISQCFPIDCKPQSPLKRLRRENIFKLFFIDIGLLCHMLEITYKEIRSESLDYKGFIAENFVQNEFISIGYEPTFSWEARGSAKSEVEFLYKDSEGRIIPVEVKSGKQTNAASLKVYTQKYRPERTLKLVGAQCKPRSETSLFWPLYYARNIKAL